MIFKEIRGLGLTKSYDGKLFVVEGCDGSGKSTQVYLLKKWLEFLGYTVFFTEWNSSELVKRATKKAKKKNLLTPTTFSLLHACDFADRYERLILPHLRAGYIVLCDRYIWTAYARDIARGCNMEWVKTVYDFAAKPTATFYFKVPVDVAVDRILMSRAEIKYYEAGMDLKLSSDPVESFKLYQSKIIEVYDALALQEDFIIIDGTLPIKQQQKMVREIVQHFLSDYKPPAQKWIFNTYNKEGETKWQPR